MMFFQEGQNIGLVDEDVFRSNKIKCEELRFLGFGFCNVSLLVFFARREDGESREPSSSSFLAVDYCQGPLADPRIHLPFGINVCNRSCNHSSRLRENPSQQLRPP